MADLIQSEIDRLLYQFGEKGLKPSVEYIDEGKRLAQNVFGRLEQNPQLSISHHIFGGSVGKKTNVLEPDLDLVVFLNNTQPPFTNALNVFKKTVEDYNGYLDIEKNSIIKTKFSIQFNFKNGMSVDLLPASPLHHEAIHQKMSMNYLNKSFMLYSSSLASRQVDFLTSFESSFAHVVIRLVKFWFKSLYFGDNHFTGGSLMMELISLAAVEQEEARKKGSLSVLQAFGDALNMIKNIDSLKLAFKEVGGGKWERAKTAFDLQKAVGAGDILNRRCFIMDPANPWNDLLADKDFQFKEKIIRYANVTKQRLHDLVNGALATVIYGGILPIFEPQPGNISVVFPGGMPTKYKIVYNNPRESMFSEIKVQKQRHMQKKEVRLAINALKWQIMSTLSYRDWMTDIQVKGVVDEEIKSLLLIAPSEYRFRYMDVILMVPYKLINGTVNAVRIGMSWK